VRGWIARFLAMEKAVTRIDQLYGLIRAHSQAQEMSDREKYHLHPEEVCCSNLRSPPRCPIGLVLLGTEPPHD
jgi:hypothetical protein